MSIGGGKEVTMFVYKNTTFNFHTVRSKTFVHYHLYAPTKNTSVDCVYILVDKAKHIALLNNIYFDAQCFTKENIDALDEISGTTVLQMSLAFINTIKKHYKLQSIHLKDNSYKRCKTDTISLALMSTLLSGDTWYGKHGFRPSINEKINPLKESIWH
jgi:hypothetical protein